LSERLGVTVWGRVTEVQTKTGDGWIHYHVALELAGTRWCSSGGWVKLGELASRIQDVWHHRWAYGNADLQLVRSKERVASYVAKYLAKPWPAVPQWIGCLFRAPRLVGWSKDASARLRELQGRE